MGSFDCQFWFFQFNFNQEFCFFVPSVDYWFFIYFMLVFDITKIIFCRYK